MSVRRLSTLLVLGLLPLCAAALAAAGETLVPLSSLAEAGKIGTRWDAKARLITIATAAAVLELRPGSREMLVRTTATGQTRRESLLLAPRVEKSGPLVPGKAVRAALASKPAPLAVGPTGLATADHPHPRAPGGIAGEVRYHNKPLAGIVLRLVRQVDGTFVRERRAVSDVEGHYRFPGVPAGHYRVYVYAGDNAQYFNRETPPVEVRRAVVQAERLDVGRVLQPQTPRPGAKTRAAEALALRWSPCPEASQYEVVLQEAGAPHEVLREKTTAPEFTVPSGTLTPGHSYELKITATADDTAFLGATAGSGRTPWRFAAE